MPSSSTLGAPVGRGAPRPDPGGGASPDRAGVPLQSALGHKTVMGGGCPRLKTARRGLQKGPGCLHDGPRPLQHAQYGFRTAQRPPRRPKRAPRGPPREPQEANLVPFLSGTVFLAYSLLLFTALKRTPRGSGEAREEPKTAPEAPKASPRRAQSASRRPQVPSSCEKANKQLATPIRPRKDEPSRWRKAQQGSPKMASEPPPKTLPRRAKEGVP